MAWYDSVEFNSLVGRTLTGVQVRGNDEIIFETEDGSFKLYHEQDCCESVSIEDIAGDVQDLVGSPILFAEESVSDRPADVPESPYSDGSETWTFYRIGTVKGTVSIRWFGSSNGYYSESVNFVKL